MYFAITTLGCKVNQYESSVIETLLKSEGYCPVADTEKADVVIINTCTVTENSDKKVRQLIGAAKKQNSNSVIVLIGCFPQAFPDEAEKLGADITLGSSKKGTLPSLIKEHLETRKALSFHEESKSLTKYEEFGEAVFGVKTRANLKIEDGCNRRCSYCIIPEARGNVRSRSLKSIKEEAEKIAQNGNKEIVLVGVNLSCFGTDTGENLLSAVKTIEKTNGIERIRLSSLEPDMIDEKLLLELSKIDKLCPHFHLSLQSGSDRTLERMNRKYTTTEYTNLVNLIYRYYKNPAVTTDIMVGFAGESDDEFNESLTYADKIHFAKMHVFTYSIRRGTAAAGWNNHIDEKMKAERYRKMSNLAKKCEADFLHSQIGKETNIIIEKRTNPEFLFGHTPNYTPVRIIGLTAERHDNIKIKITEATENYCVGIKI